MRFVIAIVTFLVAAILIGLGFAQRTIWAPSDNLTAAVTTDAGTPYLVISGRTLNANPGQQTLRVSGTDAPFVAYGRTADVLAWIGDEPYQRLSYDAASGGLVAAKGEPVQQSSPAPSESAAPSGAAATPAAPARTPAAPATDAAGTSQGADTASAAAPNPNGSDLWLEQFSGAQAATTRMNVPDSVSVIIATDGTRAAPSQVSLTWPSDTKTPWAGPLIVLGCILIVVGVVVYVLALRNARKGRGPRRGQGRGRGRRVPPQPFELTEGEQPVLPAARGRRALGRRSLVAVPVVLAGALTLAGCSADYWPSVGQTPTPSATSSPLTTQLPGQKDTALPAVTVPQLQNIVDRIAATASQADTKRDATLAATRFTGPALAERDARYQVLAKKPDYAAPVPIASSLQIELPEATTSWPRSVLTLVQDQKTPNAAPLALLLSQATPQDNYKVEYAVQVLGGTKIPDLAPAAVGTSSVPPESKLLKLPTNQLAQAYADVFAKGEASRDYGLFDETDDQLNSPESKLGAAAKAAAIKALADKKDAATLSFADIPGTADPVALQTVKAGAIVMTTVDETQTFRTTDPNAKAIIDDPNSVTAKLLGKTESPIGWTTTFEYQLMFYVPPVESDEKIQLLGYTQVVTGAKELTK